jgi:recombination protein RecA
MTVSALSAARETLKKLKLVDMNDRKVFNPDKQFDHINTGSIIVNSLIGGSKIPGKDLQICPGVPRGRIIEIYGPESSGKTTLGISICVKAQLAGGSVAIIDFENALAEGYAKAQGLNFDDAFLDIWNPPHMESGFEIIKALVESNVDVILIDSVSAMVPQKVMEGEISKDEQMGLRARKLSQFLGALVTLLRNHTTCVIFINQVRTNIKTSKYDHGPDEITSGGNALKFYASVRLKLQAKCKEMIEIVDQLSGEKKKIPIGTYTTVYCIKNKIDSHQGDFGIIFIRFGKGIDNKRTIIDIAMSPSYKIVAQNGAWISYTPKDKKLHLKIQGKEKFQTALEENPKVYESLRDEVIDKYSKMTFMTSAENIEYSDKDVIVKNVENGDFDSEDDAYDDDVKEIILNADGEELSE